MNGNAIRLFGEGTFSADESRYFDLVEDACRKSKDMVISNGQPKHAAYLIYTFFLNAKEKIRVVTGTLKRTENGVDVWANEELIDAACRFLEHQDASLEVALRDSVDGEAQQHPFIRAILERRLRGRFLLRRCDRERLKKVAAKILEMDWMTMDDRAFRLEYDTKDIQAFANFGDKNKFVRVLNDIFDLLFFRTGEDILQPAAA